LQPRLLLSTLSFVPGASDEMNGCLFTDKIRRSLVLTAAGLTLFALPGLASNCEDLATLQLPHTTITKAEVVSGGTFTPPTGQALADLPAFCRVTAVARPSADSDIVVEIWMPESNWNLRFEGTGNGGFAGKISYGALAEGVRRHYAVANTDMGMATPPGANASIFINRPERWIDWGYRATHEMTVVAKQVLRAYYTRDAGHAYFVGCSTGGEQALMESQRYPDDYDGIVGGAAANNRTGVHVSILWNFAVNEKTPASNMPAAARSLLSQAVVNACDGLDGVKDGVIADPQNCHFDPASLKCTSTNQESCLTASEVATAQQIYAGPVNPRTSKSLYPGLPRGSEFGWDGLVPAQDSAPPYAPIFQWVFGPQWDWRQFDFDAQDAIFNQKLASMVNATSPDIDAFRAHGHKLLMYHGWSDWLVAPQESINYYNAVVQRDESAGAKKSLGALDQSFRLFMVPGMAHCGGGPGATHFDALGAVVDWVEHGVAPDKIIANRLPPGTTQGATEGTLQRPLCPYPRTARYQGSGSTNDASSFACTR
jgi:feruloyl esterase